MRNMLKTHVLVAGILLLCLSLLLPACSTREPDSGQGAAASETGLPSRGEEGAPSREEGDAPPRKEEDPSPKPAPDEAAEILFQVDAEGPSKRINWVSKTPSGPDMQICFELEGRTIICSDVEEGRVYGKVDVFQSMPVENSRAVFRPRP